MSDLPSDEVWPPPIRHHPPAVPHVRPISPLAVGLITGYDILTGLLLILEYIVGCHWASNKSGNVDWIILGGYYSMIAPLIALFFLTVAYISPRLLLMGRPHARRLVMELQRSLAWTLFWITALFIAYPTLLAAHHTGGVLMLSTTLVHTLLTVAGFAAAGYLRKASEPAF